MVQRAKGSTRRRKGQASGVRAVLREYRQQQFGVGSRWHIAGRHDAVADALADGKPVIVSSSLLWHALFKAGLPADDYGRDGPLDGKYWLVDEFDVFSEWTDPHPAEREDDGQHCAGDRTCFRCDPGRTGRQTVDIPPIREVRLVLCGLGGQRVSGGELGDTRGALARISDMAGAFT